MSKSPGGQVAAVRPGSPAALAGLVPGDVIVSINGHRLRDVIDYRFYAADEALELVVQGGDGQARTVHIARDYEQDLGLEFSAPTFDGMRRCRNRCDFCFVEQMPPGLRPTLYIKDDDYRYSFLFGNYITLTNLDASDWERLAEQRLSPLYVSVHATDRALRARMLGVRRVPDVLAQLQRLGEMGIETHTQIVVTPGLNDGPALEQTITELAALYPAVASIALVPVGITRYHRCGLSPLDAAQAEGILQRVAPLQRGYRRELGVGLVYCSDEFYLLAGREVPGARQYDGFLQLANGVGGTRLLLDDWRRVRKRLATPLPRQRAGHSAGGARRITLACGELIVPVMRRLAVEVGEHTGMDVLVVPVGNRFFGETVTVSGLLTGRDVIAALRGTELGERVWLPRTMFDDTGEVTLDDLRIADIAEALGADVAMAEGLSEVMEGIVPRLPRATT